LDSDWFFDFEEIVGDYGVVSERRLDDFLASAADLGYTVVFDAEPRRASQGLLDAPDFELQSDFPGTINGFLPFQLEGFNALKDLDWGGSAIWSTGTGKTALMAALIIHHHPDLALVVVKKNNKYDMKIKLDELGRIQSTIVQGSRKRRERIYEQTAEALSLGAPVTLVLNYEKFRDDDEWLQALTTGRRVVILWDEMPSKLANRSTQLYKGVLKVLFKTYGKPRAKELLQYQFTATPIENNPEDQLSCIRLINPTIWPRIKDWELDHVRSRNPWSHKPTKFKNLEKMRLKLEFMTHQVDKANPEIAQYFPEVFERAEYIDWSTQDRRVYDAAEAIVKDKIIEGDANAFQLIRVLQMICDQPELINASAENRAAFEEELLAADDDELEDIQIRGSTLALDILEAMGGSLSGEHCNKLDRLRDRLVKHRNEKVLIFSTWGRLGMPLIEAALESWGITYRSYRGTDRQRENAKNEWRENPDLQVLLLSDAGSDSIDLPEASVVIHYNLPLKWSKLIQRQNRAHRINSQHKSVTVYFLIMADSIEERILKIITKKLGYHFSLYKEGASEILESKSLDKDDLWFLITGQMPDLI
jgi:SNF2 family DNA or RNA helicase